MSGFEEPSNYGLAPEAYEVDQDLAYAEMFLELSVRRGFIVELYDNGIEDNDERFSAAIYKSEEYAQELRRVRAWLEYDLVHRVASSDETEDLAPESRTLIPIAVAQFHHTFAYGATRRKALAQAIRAGRDASRSSGSNF